MFRPWVPGANCSLCPTTRSPSPASPPAMAVALPSGHSYPAAGRCGQHAGWCGRAGSRPDLRFLPTGAARMGRVGCAASKRESMAVFFVANQRLQTGSSRGHACEHHARQRIAAGNTTPNALDLSEFSRRFDKNTRQTDKRNKKPNDRERWGRWVCCERKTTSAFGCFKR